MGIKEETRRESYDEVLETLGQRQLDVYSELLNYGQDGATANELSHFMWKKGYFVTPERNRVHPRLHELEKSGHVFVKEKRMCSITKRNCAVYIVKI
ncbi:hypothetical protein V7124_19650 [Neobacillus niacini]|uniref:hypothetical protein n=1 Tax=Neobacillus niacini TaxID=86668 RepID=UPI002FFF5F7C